MAKRGRPRKISSPADMARLWEAYKKFCDHQIVSVTEFSAKSSEFVTAHIEKRITYTIEGFCVFIGLARSRFYETYAAHPSFRDIATRMREECEVDARAKFEVGSIPPQLAALWMGKYGYTTKVEATEEKPNELLQSLMELERANADGEDKPE